MIIKNSWESLLHSTENLPNKNLCPQPSLLPCIGTDRTATDSKKKKTQSPTKQKQSTKLC